MIQDMNVKQVIVMRTDLGMRKGKMIAQGAHSSISFLSKALYFDPNASGIGHAEVTFSEVEYAWLTGAFTKVCVRVDSEEELLKIYKDAQDAGLTVNLIVDSGLTEFNGIPTRTCLAIGPDESEKIDKITGHLRLL